MPSGVYQRKETSNKVGTKLKYGEPTEYIGCRVPQSIVPQVKKAINKELQEFLEKRESLRKAFAEKVKNTNPLNK